MVTPTPSEAVNFFWHCRVAVKLIDELPETTVTKGYALDAVRMATLCAAGRNGVQHATDKAKEAKELARKPWHKCGLVKEHVIPVGVVRTLVLDALRATRGSAPTAPQLAPFAPATHWLAPQVLAEFQQHPRAWQAAQIIREWTLLAWVTVDEHTEFDSRGLGNRMPAGWTPSHNRFARYTTCRIPVSRI